MLCGWLGSKHRLTILLKPDHSENSTFTLVACSKTSTCWMASSVSSKNHLYVDTHFLFFVLVFFLFIFLLVGNSIPTLNGCPVWAEREGGRGYSLVCSAWILYFLQSRSFVTENKVTMPTEMPMIGKGGLFSEGRRRGRKNRRRGQSQCFF